MNVPNRSVGLASARQGGKGDRHVIWRRRSALRRSSALTLVAVDRLRQASTSAESRSYRASVTGLRFFVRNAHAHLVKPIDDRPHQGCRPAGQSSVKLIKSANGAQAEARASRHGGFGRAADCSAGRNNVRAAALQRARHAAAVALRDGIVLNRCPTTRRAAEARITPMSRAPQQHQQVARVV
jgi:hypothetical protein